jgi:predicted N-acetyltransferase YhbS
MFRILQETEADRDAVEALLDLAFAPGRRALSSYRLRDGVAPVAALCLTARDDYDALAGCVRYWPVALGDAAAPGLLLGPVAVHPTRQSEGLGAMLIAQTLDRAAALGWTRVVLVGDAPYYGRFGFSREAAAALRFPPPTDPLRVLGRAMTPGAFDGVAGAVTAWRDPDAQAALAGALDHP